MAITTIQGLHTLSNVDLQVDATIEVIGDGSATLYALSLDNSENSIDSYVKLYDADQDAPTGVDVTLGNTAPENVFRVKAGQQRSILFGQGAGKSLATGLVLAAVTTGGVAGTTAPTNAVKASAFTTAFS